MASSALAVGAGAGQGLEDVLNRMLVEAKLKQLTDSTNAAQTETNRSHLATESIERERIAAADRARQSAEAERRANQRTIEEAKVRDDGRALGDEIPGGTVLDAGDSAIPQLTKAGLGGLLRGIRASSSISLDEPNALGGESTASSDPGMAPFAGREVPAGSRIKLRSSNQEKEAATEADKAAQREREEGRDRETERYHTGMLNKSGAPSIQIIPTADGFGVVDKKNLKAGVTPLTNADGSQVQPKDPSAIVTRRDLATSVGSHFDDVAHLIDEADAKGLLGPLKGRTFVEFMSGKIGSTGNPETDELMGELRTQMGMIRSGVAQLHGRAGANVGIAQSIEKKMDEGYMDPAMLKGSLQGLKKWVDTYASKKKPGEAPATGGGDAYDEYLKRQPKPKM